MKIAEELGMSEKTLYAWLRDYRKKYNLEIPASNPHIVSSPKESLKEENRRLRKELSGVTKEHEILKKPTAFFAKGAH